MKTKEKDIDGILQKIKKIHNNSQSPKLVNRLNDIPSLEKMEDRAAANNVLRQLDKRKLHPVKPKRGEIYLAAITTNVGAELNDQHLVVVIQNNKGNLYASKVNVVVIEGDGSNINPAYHIQLLGTDIIGGRLDKDPSRIVTSDILTIDKARLKQKIGTVTDDKIKQINSKLKKQLALK